MCFSPVFSTAIVLCVLVNHRIFCTVINTCHATCHRKKERNNTSSRGYFTHRKKAAFLTKHTLFYSLHAPGNGPHEFWSKTCTLWVEAKNVCFPQKWLQPDCSGTTNLPNLCTDKYWKRLRGREAPLRTLHIALMTIFLGCVWCMNKKWSAHQTEQCPPRFVTRETHYEQIVFYSSTSLCCLSCSRSHLLLYSLIENDEFHHLLTCLPMFLFHRTSKSARNQRTAYTYVRAACRSTCVLTPLSNRPRRTICERWIIKSWTGQE